MKNALIAYFSASGSTAKLAKHLPMQQAVHYTRSSQHLPIPARI